jgi:hypothetical protein
MMPDWPLAAAPSLAILVSVLGCLVVYAAFEVWGRWRSRRTVRRVAAHLVSQARGETKGLLYTPSGPMSMTDFVHRARIDPDSPFYDAGVEFDHNRAREET